MQASSIQVPEHEREHKEYDLRDGLWWTPCGRRLMVRAPAWMHPGTGGDVLQISTLWDPQSHLSQAGTPARVELI